MKTRDQEKGSEKPYLVQLYANDGKDELQKTGDEDYISDSLYGYDDTLYYVLGSWQHYYNQIRATFPPIFYEFSPSTFIEKLLAQVIYEFTSFWQFEELIFARTEQKWG